MKKKSIIYTIAIILMTLTIIVINTSTGSYSLDISVQISGDAPNRVATYYNSGTGSKISIDDIINKYGESAYLDLIYNYSHVYFYKGKEITKDQYFQGLETENADLRAQQYGKSAIRVHNTQEAKDAIKKIFSEYRIGENVLVFSNAENINWDEVNNYYMANYGVQSIRQNYYSYKIKGEFEPTRIKLNPEIIRGMEELPINTSIIRISKNEKEVTDKFLSRLIPLMQGDGSDYQKILAAYTYINNTTTYLVDNGYIDDLLASNTSIYDVFINRRSVCIGYSIGFSYLMDKMGIESYIVDQIVSYDENTGAYESVHTYNIVKLNGQFYKVDLTGNIFLGGLSPNELYDSKLNISRSAYQGGNRNYGFDYSLINNYLNEAKNTPTTTTKKIVSTTKPIVRPENINYGVYTTTKATTTKKPTTTTAKTTTKATTENISVAKTTKIVVNTTVVNGETLEIEEVTNNQGEIVTSYKPYTTKVSATTTKKNIFSFLIPTTTTKPAEEQQPGEETEQVVTTPTTKKKLFSFKKTTKKVTTTQVNNEAGEQQQEEIIEDPKTEEEINLNYVLFPLLAVVIGFYLVYKAVLHR